MNMRLSQTKSSIREKTNGERQTNDDERDTTNDHLNRLFDIRYKYTIESQLLNNHQNKKSYQ